MTNNMKKWPIKIKELPIKILFILQQFWIAINNQNLAEILKQKWLVSCLLVLTYKWKSSSLLQRKLLEHTESKQYLLDLTHSQTEKNFHQTKLCQLNTMLCTPCSWLYTSSFSLTIREGVFKNTFFLDPV